jgi:hypothetical protein
LAWCSGLIAASSTMCFPCGYLPIGDQAAPYPYFPIVSKKPVADPINSSPPTANLSTTKIPLCSITVGLCNSRNSASEYQFFFLPYQEPQMLVLGKYPEIQRTTRKNPPYPDCSAPCYHPSTLRFV